jgi:hypothetical protein
MFDILHRRGRASRRLDRHRCGAYILRKAVGTRTECSSWRARAAGLACCKLKAPTLLAGVRYGDDEILTYSRRVGQTVRKCDFNTPGPRASGVAHRTCPEFAGNTRKTWRRPFGISVEADRNCGEKSRVGQIFQMATRHRSQLYTAMSRDGTGVGWRGSGSHDVAWEMPLGGATAVDASASPAFALPNGISSNTVGSRLTGPPLMPR